MIKTAGITKYIPTFNKITPIPYLNNLKYHIFQMLQLLEILLEANMKIFLTI